MGTCPPAPVMLRISVLSYRVATLPCEIDTFRWQWPVVCFLFHPLAMCMGGGQVLSASCWVTYHGSGLLRGLVVIFGGQLSSRSVNLFDRTHSSYSDRSFDVAGLRVCYGFRRPCDIREQL